MNACGTAWTASAAEPCDRHVCSDGGWPILVLIGLLALTLAVANFAPAGQRPEGIEMAATQPMHVGPAPTGANRELPV